MNHPLMPWSDACRRYERAQKPLSQFLSDINRYKDLIEEVLSENSQETVKFLYVDCSPLKQVSLSLSKPPQPTLDLHMNGQPFTLHAHAPLLTETSSFITHGKVFWSHPGATLMRKLL